MTNPSVLEVTVPSPEFMDDYDTGARYVPPPQPKQWVDGKIGGKVKSVTFVAQIPSVDKIQTRDEKTGEYLKSKKTGNFQAVVHGITLPNNENHEIRDTYIGTGQYQAYDRKTNQPIPGKFRNASPAMDYFRAFGIASRPGTVEEYEQLFQATAGGQGECQGDWSAWDKDNQKDVAKKWEDFPDQYELDGKIVEPTPEALAAGAVKNGKKQPFISVGGKNYWARLGIKRWISAAAD